jgi:hypothetical protein
MAIRAKRSLLMGFQLFAWLDGSAMRGPFLANMSKNRALGQT